MTRLKEEIYKAVCKKFEVDENEHPNTASLLKEHAAVTAEVAKRYIENAFDAGHSRGCWLFDEAYGNGKIPFQKDQWMKENGVIE